MENWIEVLTIVFLITMIAHVALGVFDKAKELLKMKMSSNAINAAIREIKRKEAIAERDRRAEAMEEERLIEKSIDEIVEEMALQKRRNRK